MREKRDERRRSEVQLGRGRFLLAAALAAALACERTAGVAPAVASGSAEVGMAAPFAVELDLSGTTLRATLRNRSGSGQGVLHDRLRQPSRLRLSGSGGEVESFDTRSVMKFDNSVEPDDYARLDAGAGLPLGEASFERRGSGWAIRWGPFEFEDLPAGKYRAQVEFESARDDAVDPESGEPTRVSGVWLGRVESPPVDVSLGE
jgi:hypothetical protein